MSKLKQKFKNVKITTPTVTDWSTQMQQPIEMEYPKIDMELSPSHISERVSLSQYSNIMKQLEGKSRLSVDQRFNDRTKARRELIRKCLDL